MEWIKLLIPLLIGIILGTLYFGGLWLTVQKINSAMHPALWMFISFIIRIGVLLITFYWLVMVNWAYLAVAFIGFLIARSVFIQRFKPVERYPAGEEYGI